jgi:alpha-beta hydrolase superfamily lysophospholipase
MSAETFYLEMTDGARVAVHAWLPSASPTAVLQLCHGMAEYAMRYERFAERAVASGYAVLAADLRGHGLTAGSLDKLGYLADQDGFARVVEDQRELTCAIKDRFPGIAVILFGHSFGSFVAQGYIERYGADIVGSILSGTRGPDPVAVVSGRLLSRVVSLFVDRRKPSRFLTYVIFGGCNKRIPDATSPNAWLSRDPSEVDKYDASPWSGFPCSAGFYRDLMDGLSRIHRNREIAKIPRTLPVLLLFGEDDPIGSYGKTVRALEQRYRASGMERVTVKAYPKGRHELLNDTNRDEVTVDILGWVGQTLRKTQTGQA